MKRQFDTSIVLPAYNEQKIIKSTLQKLAAFVTAHPAELGQCQVVVVAAGDDNTANIARTFSGSFDALHIITPGARVGKGRDVRLGMQAARGNVQIFMDADLSTPLTHILPMIKMLNQGADVVIGSRNLSQTHKGVLRRALSVASNLLIRTVLFPGIRDTQCGFKGFTAKAAQNLFAHQVIQGWGFDLEVLQYAKENGYTVQQLPIPDWREQRKEDFRGERLGGAALTTLRDLSIVRLRSWGRLAGRHWIACTLLAMLAACSLSLWIGLKQSVWFDEAYSIMLIQQSWGDLLALTAVDAHPPLYYLLLKTWSLLFGTGELALRSFSALCGALAVGLALVLARRLFNARAAALSAPFLVLAPFLLRYHFEIRMYALASLICLAATLVLVRAMQATGKKQLAYWLAYAALVALGMYTLYYTAFIWIAHLVWLLYMMRRQVPRTPLFKQPWVGAFAASIILYGPWLATLFDQLTHSALSGVSQRVTFSELISVVSFVFIFTPHWDLTPWSSLGIVLALIALVYLTVQVWRITDNQKRPWLMLLLLYVLVPIALMTVGSLPPLSPMFLERYTSHYIIVGYLFVGVVVAMALIARVRAAGLIATFFTGLLVAGVVNLNQTGNFTFERLMYPQAKQVAAHIGYCDSSTTVLAGDPLLYFELHYYMPDCNLYFFNGTKPIGNRGGFAILHNSPKQYFEGADLPGSTVYFIYTNDQPPVFLPSDYRQSAATAFQKFHIATYHR